MKMRDLLLKFKDSKINYLIDSFYLKNGRLSGCKLKYFSINNKIFTVFMKIKRFYILESSWKASQMVKALDILSILAKFMKDNGRWEN